MPEGGSDGGVLFVHAHPDDECAGTGGTIARLVAEGVRVDLVTCTDGAEGEIHDSTLDAEEARPRLAAIRAGELACSIEALGGGAIQHHLLGYRDSGMMGTEPNGHPDSFWQADIGEATRRLVEIVRGARPAAMVSYDENGNYGHPDHINAARIAREAYAAAADASVHPAAGPPWQVSRLYELAFSREGWTELMIEMTRRGIKLPWVRDEATSQGSTDEPDADEWGRPDAEITTRMDVIAHLDAKRRSMECHRTQRQDLGWLLELPDDLADRILGTETFVLRWLDGADVPPTHREVSMVPAPIPT